VTGAALVLAAALAVAQGPAEVERPVAALRGLDKFSGLTHDFSAPVGGEAVYERLTIRVLACRDRPGDDAAAYLEIRDARDPERLAFSGWMIASTPALSALDHPRYDVWLLQCSASAPDAS
jgi:hypothetical protein